MRKKETMSATKTKFSIRRADATAAFEHFLSSERASRFRLSDVAALVYPFIAPRDRHEATAYATKLLRAAATAGRVQRTGHLHWFVTPVGKTRRLVDGREVPEVAGVARLTVDTRCPQKWAFVDLETGEVFQGDAGGRLIAAETPTLESLKLVASRHE